jgi:hypothetical protein
VVVGATVVVVVGATDVVVVVTGAAAMVVGTAACERDGAGAKAFHSPALAKPIDTTGTTARHRCIDGLSALASHRWSGFGPSADL